MNTNTNIKNGVITTFHANGKKHKEETYKNGKAEGLHTFWDEYGHKTADMNLKNGKLNGLTTFWDEDGHKINEVTFKNGCFAVSSQSKQAA